MGTTPVSLESRAGLLDRLLEHSRFLHHIEATRDGIVRACSPAVVRTVGRPLGEVIDHSLWSLLPAGDAEALQARLGGASAAETTFLLNLLDAAGLPRTLACWLDPTPDGFAITGEPIERHEWAFHAEEVRTTSELSVLLRENVRMTRALEEAHADLETSYWHLKKVQEFLPICTSCGKVKSSESTWESLATYLRANSLFLSHGYCPTCAAQRLGGVEKDGCR